MNISTWEGMDRKNYFMDTEKSEELYQIILFEKGQDFDGDTHAWLIWLVLRSYTRDVPGAKRNEYTNL